MARKIFGFYITKNNPRELLWIIARQEDKMGEIRKYIENNKYLSKKALNKIIKKKIGTYKGGE